MRTCSAACRNWYKRYRAAGNPEIEMIRIFDESDTPDTPGVSHTPPSHRQAINDSENTELLRELVTEIGSLKSMLIALMGGQRLDDAQKKSDFAAGNQTFQKPIDTPVVTAVFNEEEARRRSIANTIAALDDF